MDKKIYKTINEWYHPEIDYYEMLENLRWTEDDIQRAIKTPEKYPKEHVTMTMHGRAWEFDESTKDIRPSKQQIFQFWNKQFNDELAKVIKGMNPQLILEVGAGDGILSKILSDRGFNIVAVDDYSWTFNKRYFKVKKMDYKKALEEYKPDVVLSSWMPLHEDWTPFFRKTKSVKHYILIGEVEGCVGGDWKDRKTWPIHFAKEASKYALCRTDMLWWQKDKLSDFMMEHSEVNYFSRTTVAKKGAK